MARKIKYITYMDKDGLKNAIMFSEQDDHAVMLNKLDHIHVIGAGFCNLTFDETKDRLVALCYGKSESLNVTADPEDSMLLTGIYLGFEYSI